MEDPNASAPIASSGGEDSLLVPDPNSQIGSAHGSFQNEGFLGGGGGGAGGDAGSSSDAEFGFSRPDFGQGQLAGTVQIYGRHVFLCYKDPQVWPSRIEAAEFDRLPRLLSAALVARKSDMKKRTRLTLCEGEDGTESSNGDVLIFPDMIRYRCLTHFDVENFVEEVLVKDTEWLPGAVETLTGSYIFVCSHGSRDRRCGTCGPAVIKKFKEEIQARGLEGQVSVSPSSHIGGHKYAGNVIIFSPSVDGEVTGHWYGYVSPDDVPLLLEQHIGKGEVVTHLWRGQMGLTEEEQKKAYDHRLQLNGETEREKVAKESTPLNGTLTGAAGCCQGVGNFTCCQNLSMEEKLDNHLIPDPETEKTVETTTSSSKESKADSSKGVSTHKVCAMPTWFESWEREDTYATLAVAAAVVSVVVAYGCYRQLR